MSTDRPLPALGQLVFVGLNGWVAALDRDSGEIVWKCSELKSGYTTLLLDGDRLIASTNGYLYCLDPQTGKVVWSNPLRGLRTGVAHVVSVRGQSTPVVTTQAQAVEAQRAAAAHGGAAAGS
jgi:outer membrane protein assembly factor BamB